MKFRWKDFLYFQKSDRNAIILLSTLIILCGVAYLFSGSIFKNESIYTEDQAYAEFDRFQKGLTETASVEKKTETENSLKKESKSQQAKKLNEGETIDINGANVVTLKRIPGVGDEYAKRIADYRDKLGGFANLDQLKEVQGVTSKRYDKIAPYVTIKRKPKVIRINKLSVDELVNHPYVNEKQAQTIIDIRRQKGKITTLEELLESSDFSQRDIERLFAYISFN